MEEKQKKQSSKELEFDENKTVEQLWREGKLGVSDYSDFVLGIDNLGGTAYFKIPIDQILRVTRYLYVLDATALPLRYCGDNYSVSHKGRLVCNRVTKETYDYLVERKKKDNLNYKITTYIVDMNDPIDGRRTYLFEDDMSEKTFREQVLKSRAERKAELKTKGEDVYITRERFEFINNQKPVRLNPYGTFRLRYKRPLVGDTIRHYKINKHK